MRIAAAILVTAGLIGAATPLRSDVRASREAPAESQPASGLSVDPAIDVLIDDLRHDSYERREAATRRILQFGPVVADTLRARLSAARDAEQAYRLQYILENIRPPDRAALVARASPTCGIAPGDLVTHVNGRRVRSVSELRQTLGGGPRDARVSIHTLDGPREVAPVRMSDLEELSDFVAPRGLILAEALRLYATGYAEKAYELIRDNNPGFEAEELSPILLARMAYTAGDATAALRALEHAAEAARPLSGSEWNENSLLDQSGPGKSPLALDLLLLSQVSGAGQRPVFETPTEPDLRVQRVLVPAGRSVDAFLTSAELWHERFRDLLGRDADATRIAGNQLAVCAWMLHSLGLRSECCRLVEPRSKILRTSPQGVDKWVRVDTDAWLPLLGGREAEALDLFYDAALGILQRPPEPSDPDYFIRSVSVAAQLPVFTYLAQDETRRDEALAAVNVQDHVAMPEFARWMFYVLRRDNEAAIRRHAQSLLPNCSGGSALDIARGVALLEYVSDRPQADVFRSARERAAESPDAALREVWTAAIDALGLLAQNRVEAARERLARGPDGVVALEPIRATIAYRLSPPESAGASETTRDPLLALDADDGTWVILTRDRRVLRIDADGATPLAGLAPGWMPNPLSWPWIGRQRSTGRTWAYDRRRVTELAGEGSARVEFNVSTEDIAAFDGRVGPWFDRFAELLEGVADPAAESGEFLRAEMVAHRELTVDPDLAELAFVRVLERDSRVAHVAVRGGSQALVDSSTGTVLTSRWIQQAVGLGAAPRFSAEALTPAGDAEPPRVLLCSDEGLVLVDFAGPAARRIPIPGDAPHAAVVPEWAPYRRADSSWYYFARLPWEGGAIYRWSAESGEVQPRDAINVTLPSTYYAARSRVELRALLDERLAAAGLPALEGFLEAVAQELAAWEQETEALP